MGKISVREDKSYLIDIDLISIENGVAELGIHSIRFSLELTEEQKQENRKIAKILTNEQWSERCKQSKIEEGKIIEKVIDLIHENFIIYQYKNENVSYSKDNWDLFFWCNCGDMSYVTLNPNEDRSNEQQIKDIERVLELLKTIETDKNIDLAIQYKIIYNEEKVREIVEPTYKQLKDKFIEYMGTSGKIKEIGKNYKGKTVYGFFKKGARKNYYQISDGWFLQKAFNNELAN